MEKTNDSDVQQKWFYPNVLCERHNIKWKHNMQPNRFQNTNSFVGRIFWSHVRAHFHSALTPPRLDLCFWSSLLLVELGKLGGWDTYNTARKFQVILVNPVLSKKYLKLFHGALREVLVPPSTNCFGVQKIMDVAS